MSEKLSTEASLKKKYKSRDFKKRQEINQLNTELNSLKEQLQQWSEDNSILKQHNLDLIETVKTMNLVIRGFMFQKCDDCGEKWKMSLIKSMMKNLTIDCPGCSLYVQIK